MHISFVAPGCFHVEGPSNSALIGSPPEILKALLKQKKKIPHVGVLPDLSHKNGVSQMAFEFLGYWFLFVDQGYQMGKKFRVLGTRDMCERLYDILRVTLLGPGRSEMKKWGLSKTRIETLAKMADGMAVKRAGSILQIEDLFEFVHMPDEEGEVAVPLFSDSADILIKRMGNNRYEISERGKVHPVDLNFEGEQLPPLADLSGTIEKPERLRLKVLGCYTGFDPAGPTTGMLLWVNGNGFLVDSPAGISKYLKQVGVAKDRLTAIIQTHVHDDHCALSELLLSEHSFTIISTREIFECTLLKVSRIIGEPIEVVRSMVRFVEVIPGKNYRMYGAAWEFFYTVHSIPTIGFRVTVPDENGKPHTLLHSSDLDHFSGMDQLVKDGAVSQEHVDRMRSLVRGDECLAMIDAGGGMIHGEPADWDKTIVSYPGTEFLFYHINPSKVDPKYPVAKPGWGKTYLPERVFPQSVYSGVLQTLKLFEVKDPHWINVIFSQGQVLDLPNQYEVVKKGQEGDSFYFILSGSLDVLDAENKKDPLLATLEGGDFFGEMSIINRSKTNATVVSRTPVVLFKLPGDLFLEFVEKNDLRESFSSLWKKRPLISSVEIFRDLDPTAKHEISLLAKTQQFAKEELIVRQGSKTEDFFIISSGRVQIVRKSDQGRVNFSVELKAGDFFGENVAMGYTDKRNASAQALTDVTTLVISSRELRDLAKRMPILRHKLHLVMKSRGMADEVLEKASVSVTGSDIF
ncbi:MAG TPA: cyclic nucleotide-binding domain-containing protein [bacterium]|nr:cyclic nucleotide-binding domain-containing protein [bacterium]